MPDAKLKPAPRGRPVKKKFTMPEPIPDTPENIARALLTTPPKKGMKMSGTISRTERLKSQANPSAAS